MGVPSHGAGVFPKVTSYQFGGMFHRPTAIRVVNGDHFEALVLPHEPYMERLIDRFFVSHSAGRVDVEKLTLFSGFAAFAPDGALFVAPRDITFPGSAKEIPVVGYAPGLNLAWTNKFGGTDFEQVSALTPTREGGVILKALTRSPAGGQKESPAFGDGDIWLVKVSSTGLLEWETTIGTTGQDNPMGQLIQTSDGGYLLVTTSSSGPSGMKLSGHHGEGDFWVVRLSSSGAVLWERSFGGAQHEMAMAAVEHPQSGFLVGGSSASGVSGTKTRPNRSGSPGTNDFYLVHISSEGDQINDWVYGTKGDEVMDSLLTQDDAIIMHGGAKDAEVDGVNRMAEVHQSAGGWMVVADLDGKRLYDVAIPAGPGFGGSLLHFGSRRYIVSGPQAESAVVVDFQLPPEITQAPQTVSGVAGDTVRLAVQSDWPFQSELSYQWLLDGSPITGATNQLLDIEALSSVTAGDYSVVVSNSFGSTSSTPATVSLVDPAVHLVLVPGLVIRGTVGAEYEIQVRRSVQPEPWTALTNIVLTNATQLWTDIEGLSIERRFYRALRKAP